MDKYTIFKNARIMWRNFSGKPDKYNTAGGKRNFCLALDESVVDEMIADGWNVKKREAQDGYSAPLYYLPVEVSWKKEAPKIVLISGDNRENLDELTVGVLDNVQIEKVDLSIEASQYNMSGRSGIKAYLHSLYLTAVRDELEEIYGKYDDSRDYIEPGRFRGFIR